MPDQSDEALLPRVRRAALIGALVGLVPLLWMASSGTGNLFAHTKLGDFYDAQAHAWLDGRWDISIDVLEIEAFFRFDEPGQEFVDGPWRESLDLIGVEEFFRDQSSYMYQGPVPAAFRLPVVAVTDRLDGRMTGLSIIVAALVAAWFTFRLTWATRQILRPGAALGRLEEWAVGTFTFVVVGGSAFLYLAGRTWVYHEALSWGVAFCLGAIYRILCYSRAPTMRNLVWVGAFITLTVLTRVSVGIGPMVALAALGGAHVLVQLRRTPALSDHRWRVLDRLAPVAPQGATGVGPFVAMAGVGVVALGSYMAVNVIKFRSLTSVPFDEHFYTLVDPARRQFLEVNDGYFGLQFAPSTSLAYLRPDGIRFDSLFPFIDFARFPARVIGDVQFDHVDRVASVPSAFPFLVVLALVGAVALVARRLPPGADPSQLVIPLFAGAGAAVTIIPFGYIANRYLADFMPLLVVAGLIGLHVVLDRVGGGRAPRPMPRRLAISAFAVLALAGFWINGSLGLLMQRLYGTMLDEGRTTSFLQTRLDIDDAMPWTTEVDVQQGGTLPPTGPADQLFVLGECAALYVSDGIPSNAVRPTPWNPVERSAAAGRHVLDVTLPAGTPGRRTPVFTSSGTEGDAVLMVEYLTPTSVRFEYSGAGLPGRSAPLAISPGRTERWVVAADPHLGTLNVSIGGVVEFETYYEHPEPILLGVDVLGRDDLDDRFAGTFEERPGTDMALCHRLLDR